MRSINIGKLSEIQALENEGDEAIFWVFENVFCDSNGEKFVDINEPSDVDKIEIAVLRTIMEDVRSFLNPNLSSP